MVIREKFDACIGRLDRSLSEFLTLDPIQCDKADIRTLKHHAEDLIGVGQKMLDNIQNPVKENSNANSSLS